MSAGYLVVRAVFVSPDLGIQLLSCVTQSNRTVRVNIFEGGGRRARRLIYIGDVVSFLNFPARPTELGHQQDARAI